MILSLIHISQEGETGKAIDAYNALESSIGMNEALSMQKYKLYNQLEQSDAAFNEIEKLAIKYPMEARYQIILGDLHPVSYTHLTWRSTRPP